MSTSTRRLAAIMFTDIAGYTAMMQTDEPRALAIRQRHREVFERQHAAYRGQIVQYYGDGTLSVFDSAVDAVACAVAMQREFRQEPVVPLRIGLHTGDILISETEVIGDGVNLASRVESMAVPGAVLISESVYDQIKNQPDFSGKSLGLFTFKNVTKPIEVFALMSDGLQVPHPKELTGKFLKRTSSDGDWWQRLPVWAKYVGGMLLFLVLAPFIYAPLLSLFDADASPRTIEFVDANGQTVTREVLPADARKSLYLGTFEAPSTDTTLNWSSLGMPHALEFEFDQDPYLYTYFEEEKKLTSLRQQLQAAVSNHCQFLIRGSVSRTDEALQAVVSLHAVPSGQLVKTFTQQAASLLPLADSISIHVKQSVGLPAKHLATFPDLPLSEMLTRSPAAYAAYASGLYATLNRDVRYFNLLQSATELDSTFAWAAFSLANILYFYQRSQEQAQSQLKLATQHIGRMPALYAVYVRQLTYKMDGQADKALELLQLMTQLEPDKESHWLQLIQELFLQEQYDHCLQAIAQYRKLRDEPAAQQMMEARCFLWLGQPENGLKVVESHLREQSQDPEAQLLKGQLLLAGNERSQAQQVFTQGSLRYADQPAFGYLAAHCEYLQAHDQQLMSAAQAEVYAGNYWVSNLTSFRFLVTVAQERLTMQVKGQVRFFIYQMSDSTFGAANSITVTFRYRPDGQVRLLILDQPGGQRLGAVPVSKPVSDLFAAFRADEIDRADSLIGPTMAAAPGDSIVSLMDRYLRFRQQPAYAQLGNRHAAYVGRYQLLGQAFVLMEKEGNLYFYQPNNSQGLDPFRLFAFDTDQFFILEDTRTSLSIRVKDGQGQALLFHAFGSDQVMEAPRLPEK
jgi:class 3 adenylate cyclase